MRDHSTSLHNAIRARPLDAHSCDSRTHPRSPLIDDAAVLSVLELGPELGSNSPRDVSGPPKHRQMGLTVLRRFFAQHIQASHLEVGEATPAITRDLDHRIRDPLS
jgi:hypothetical protein